MCKTTPDAYYSTLYEVAVCADDPMVTNTLDRSTCETVWENSSGAFVNPVNLMSGAETLSGTISRPSDGIYPYMLAVVDPLMQAKFSLTIEGSSGTDGTYYSTSNVIRRYPLMTTTASGYGISPDVMTNFSQINTCDPKLVVDMGAGGVLSAYLVNDSYTLTSTAKNVEVTEGGGDQSQYPYAHLACDGATKVLGVQKMLNGGITISNKTSSLNLALRVTDNGGLAVDGDGDGDPDYSYPGPWMGVLSTTEVQ